MRKYYACNQEMQNVQIAVKGSVQRVNI